MLTINHNYYNVLPNNKSSKDAGQVYSKRRYFFGIFILFLVNVLWVLSAELTKYIYSDIKLDRPFLVTYLRSSLLLVYLIVLCFTPPTKDPCRPTDYTQLVEPSAETDEENYYNEANSSLVCGDSTFVPVRAGETTDSDDAAPRAVRFNKVAEVRVMSAAQAGEALLARLSWAASVRATEHAQRRAAAAATRRHLRLAVFFALPWFAANYLYRFSLVHASTSVATIYLSTTSAFALSLGALFAQGPGDRFTTVKCASVLVSTAGLVLIGTVGGKHGDWASALSALGAAFCYSIHLITFRRELRKSEGVNSPLLAGLVGCACAGLTWIFGVVLNWFGTEHVELPTISLWSWLLLDAAIGPLLFEALWLWGYSLTSPRAATMSLCLVLPISVVVELCLGRGSSLHTLSALLLVLGWLLASVEQSSVHDFLSHIRSWVRTRQPTAVLRNLDLDEQTEALMSTEEPT